MTEKRNRFVAWVHALTGGQAAVLIFVGVISTLLLWSKANSLHHSFYSFGTPPEVIAQWDRQESDYRGGSIVCAVFTLGLAFTWFGRTKGRE